MSQMAPPKKHKKAPYTAKERSKAKWTPRVTLTLPQETQDQLEAVGATKGLVGLSAVVRYLAAEAHRKIKPLA